MVRISGLVAAASLLAAPAFAGDAKCFWNAAPETVRTAFLAKAASGLPGQDDFVAVAGAVSADTILKQCGVTDANSDAAAAAFDGYLVEVAATRRLETLKIATGERLDAAWMSMDPAMRQGFLDSAAVNGAADQHAIADFVRHAGLSDADLQGPGGPSLIAYITGRAQRAAGEAKF